MDAWGETKTFGRSLPATVERLAYCAASLLAVVRNSREALAKSPRGRERERFLALLAQGEVAAELAGAALEPKESALGDRASRDAVPVVARALARALPVTSSLGVSVFVKGEGRPIPLRGSVRGLVRALAVAVRCAAIASGAGGGVGLSIGREEDRFVAVVRAERTLRSRPLPAPSLPGLDGVGSLLDGEGGAFCLVEGFLPPVWRIERPLDPLVARARWSRSPVAVA